MTPAERGQCNLIAINCMLKWRDVKVEGQRDGCKQVGKTFKNHVGDKSFPVDDHLGNIAVWLSRWHFWYTLGKRHVEIAGSDWGGRGGGGCGRSSSLTTGN